MFGMKMVGGDVVYSKGSSSHSPWLFMLGFAYLPLVSSWICPPSVFKSPAFSTLMRLFMDLLLNIYFITSVGVQVCDRRPSVRRVLWLTMHNKLLQD